MRGGSPGQKPHLIFLERVYNTRIYLYSNVCVGLVLPTHKIHVLRIQDDIDNLKLSLGLPLSDSRVIVDWFSATFKKDVYSVEYIIEFLQDFIEFPAFPMFDETIDYSNSDNEILEQSPYLHNIFSETGYKQSIAYNNIVIFYDSYGAIERYKLSFSVKVVERLNTFT